MKLKTALGLLLMVTGLSLAGYAFSMLIWKLPYWPLPYLGIATIVIAVAGLLEERLSAEVTVEILIKKEKSE